MLQNLIESSHIGEQEKQDAFIEQEEKKTELERISLRWLIQIINPVDKTQLSRYTSHRRSTTVSLETYPSIHLERIIEYRTKGAILRARCRWHNEP